METFHGFYFLLDKHLHPCLDSWVKFETPGTRPQVLALSSQIFENQIPHFSKTDSLDLAFYDATSTMPQIGSDQNINPGTLDASIIPGILKGCFTLNKISPLPKFLFVIAATLPSNPLSLIQPTLSNVPAGEKPGRIRFVPTTPELFPPNPSPSVLVSEIELIMSTYDAIDASTLQPNRIHPKATPLTESPLWVQDFSHHMSRRREISVEGYQLFLRCSEFRQNDPLGTTIRSCFVCSDQDVTVKSMGQCIQSRHTEAINLMDTCLPKSSIWDESGVLSLFRQFGALDRAAVFPELVVVAEKNKTLPNDMGVPTTISGIRTWYKYKPDVSLLRGLEPYIFLEFESASSKTDYYRMLLYGASTVRWMNRVGGHCFILTLLYVSKEGNANLSFMYEDFDSGWIHHVQHPGDLRALAPRLQLLTTIYNIIDREPIPNLSHILTGMINPIIEIVPRGAVSGFRSGGRRQNKTSSRIPTVVKHQSLQSTSLQHAKGNDSNDRQNARGTKRKKIVSAPDLRDPAIWKKGPDSDEGGDGAGGVPGKEGGGGAGGGAATGHGRAGGNEGVVTRAMAKGARGGASDRVQVARSVLLKNGYYTVKVVDGNVLKIVKTYGRAATGRPGTCLIAKILHSANELRFYKARLKHINVIKSEAIILTPNRWCIVVLPELVPLENTLNNKGSLSLRRISGMITGLANGVQFLHESKIAHMDIKPGNLVHHPTTFILQIIDFNLVIWVTSPNQTVTDCRGTPGWMAPGRFLVYLCLPMLTACY
ncbi:hypothetical protein D9757_008320 [Collybiopsis confluens]|uniref:Protein kinase domain-containing protein n=1 Tax=Collybiopsis confluens TaxID=2823264 RepID=A0A8H5M5P0_9AGAR|nr:hypothetical protein D9757_008320 [Collybiopsis confluens]